MEAFARASTPLEALRSATVTAARALGMEDTMGSLEVEKKADLVVLSENPLGEISRVRDVVMVVQDSKRVQTRITRVVLRAFALSGGQAFIA